MSEIDQLNPGKFRDAEFLYVSSDAEPGRRTVVHQYPGRDYPYVEDLGRKARRWTLELLVAGNGYMARRDQLLAALEAPGPGTLVHPTLGTLTVAAVNVRGPRESTREGGLARFSVTFVEAGDNRQPSSSTDHRSRVSARAEAVDTALIEDITAAIDVSGPDFIAADAAAQVEQMADAVGAVIGSVAGLSEHQLLADADTLAASASSLVRAPADLAGKVIDLLGAIAGTAHRPADALASLRGLWDWLGSTDGVPQTTPGRRQQVSNRAATQRLVQTGATVAAIRTAGRAEYESQQAAEAARLELNEQIDTLALAAADATYAALVDLRAAISADLASRPGLPGIRAYTPATTLPALVIAHTLYGDAAREADIVARNRPSHPGFVSGGQALEVLNA